MNPITPNRMSVGAIDTTILPIDGNMPAAPSIMSMTEVQFIVSADTADIIPAPPVAATAHLSPSLDLKTANLDSCFTTFISSSLTPISTTSFDNCQITSSM
jgi:hypothetical protein